MGFDINRLRKNKPSEWLDWLSDEPLPAAQRRQAATTRPQPLARSVQPRVHQAPSYASAPARPMRPDVIAPTKTVTPVQVQSAPVGPPGMEQPIQTIVPKPAAQVVAQAPPQVRPTAQSSQPTQPMRPMARSVDQRPLYQQQKPQAISSMVSNQSTVGTQATGASTAAVSIQISMPKFKMPRLPVLPYKRIGIVAGGVVVIVGVSISGYQMYSHVSGAKKVAVKGASVSATPTFDPLAPGDKPQLGQGNGTAENTAYDKDRGLYGFKDTLMGFGITVSQHALPENLKKKPEDLKKVAESMGGDQSQVDTAFGMAYISTASKNEAQRVVFIYQDKMIFMNSYKRFDNDTWKYYIETLR